MDPHRKSRALRIFNLYQETLTDISHLLSFGVPRALLKHSREDITHAIRDLAQLIQADWNESEISLKDLGAAYQSLASFVPDDDAKIGAKLYRAMKNGDYAVLSSPVADAAAQISRNIELAARGLEREFEEFMRPKDDPLLSEVDAFLNEFERKRAPSSG